MTNIATNTMTAGALMRKPGSRRFQTVRARDASVIIGLHSSSSGGGTGGCGGASRSSRPQGVAQRFAANQASMAASIASAEPPVMMAWVWVFSSAS